MERVCVRLCVSSEHCEQVANFHAWSSKMPRHDKPGSMASASDALFPLLDIDPGFRIEWDFNPPETCAARHTVRAVKTEELKEVQKYL